MKIPPMMAQSCRGWSEKRNLRFEVQLNFGSCTCTKKWRKEGRRRLLVTERGERSYEIRISEKRA